MTKLELIKKYLALKSEFNAAEAFRTVVSEPFAAPVDLTPDDCEGLTNPAFIAKTARTGTCMLGDERDRSILLARLVKKNPNGRVGRYGRSDPGTGGGLKFSIWLPATIINAVEQAAAAAGVTRNRYIRTCIEEKLSLTESCTENKPSGRL